MLSRWLYVASLAAIFVSARAIAAQVIHPDVGLGAAVPTGPLGEGRGIGPLVRLGFVVGDTARRIRLRVEGEAAWMPAREARGRTSSPVGDWRAFSLVGSVLIGPRGSRVASYLVLGAAAQGVDIGGQTNPYGTLAGVRAGAGVRGRVGAYVLRVEVTPHAVLSDFGTGRDFAVGTYWPISVGLTF